MGNEYEKTPSMKIERMDGSFTYIFKNKIDPTKSKVMINNEMIEWTSFFNKMMVDGEVKK